MPAPTLSQFQYLRGFVDAILVWLTEQDAAETAAREAAINAEASARQAAVTTLSGQIGSLSSGTTTALADKADAVHTHAASAITSGTLATARIGTGTPSAGRYVDGGTGAWTALPTTDLSGYAPLNSPALTGNPTAPTQASGNDSTRVSTTAFVARTERWLQGQIDAINTRLDNAGIP